MIVDLLLGAIENLLIWLSNLFPAAPDLPYLDNLASLLSDLGAMNYFLPIAELATVMAAVMLVFPFFAGTSLLLWILAQLRGSAARG